MINLGGGRETTVNQVCDIVLDAFGHARATYPVIAGDAQPGDLQRSAADITKARELLGWSPRISVEAGMAATIAWAKAHRTTRD